MTKTYLFKSQRLGFRNWVESDKVLMAEINANPKVMEYFPAVQTYEQTAKFVNRMQQQFSELGYCYFAVDKLDTQHFIGFIGLSASTFEADFAPFVDIGWRLAEIEWGKGYATEGALRCLDFAFNKLELDKIVAICPVINKASERVMQKIGMTQSQFFEHPLLKNYRHLETCVLYEIELT